MAVSRGITKGVFLSLSAEEIAKLAKQRAEPSVRRSSKTLANAMRVRIGPKAGHANVYIPHYFAVYVHDGVSAPRSPPAPRRAYVWFANPKDDPRLSGGVTPERFAQIKRPLNIPKADFRELIEQGRLIVRKTITKPTEGNPFFSNEGGMRGFAESIGPMMQERFSQYVTQVRLDGLLDMSGRLTIK